ncbi:MAG: phosphopantetheine-binding protein [Alphaproteobacteria bacterium]|nr:phosphopantetheine-binding protein [Alphaproteobacteria bacterium]
MTKDEILALVFAELENVAPGCAPANADPGANLQDELDIDSMDFLNFVIAMHERLNVEIPESDYPKLATLNGIVVYLQNKAQG